MIKLQFPFTEQKIRALKVGGIAGAALQGLPAASVSVRFPA
jgi:hypothetical protein